MALLFGMAGRAAEGQSRFGSGPAGQKLMDLLPQIWSFSERFTWFT